MKNILRLTALLICGVMALTACSGGSSGNTSTTAAPTAAAAETTASAKSTSAPTQTSAPTEAAQAAAPSENKKDQFIFVLVSEPANIGQAAVNNNGRLCTIQCYDSLLMENKGDRTDLLPNLAESWEFSEDGLELSFKIKEGVKFHNGETLTTEDVAFSINNALTVAQNAAMGAMIDSCESVDDTHVKVTLKYAYKPILNILAQPGFCIYNKAYYEKVQAEGGVIDRVPMGTGAYKFVDWKSGEEINFTRFDDYHGEKAKVKDLKIKIMTDGTTAALAIESGECDAFLGVSTADMPRLDANPDTEILRAQSSSFHALFINTKAEPFDNELVRQAVAKAINVEEVYVGGHDSIGWITTQPMAYGVNGYDESFKATEFDLEGAKALLAEAGYPNGFQCTLKVKSDSYFATPAQVCQENLRKLGLDCEILVMETGSFDADCYTNGEFQIAYDGTGGNYPDADAYMYQRFHSSYIGQVKCNVTGCNSPEVDGWLEAARKSLDDKERLELYRNISEYNKEHVFYIPLVTSTNSVVVRSEVEGAYPHAAGAYRLALWSFK